MSVSAVQLKVRVKRTPWPSMSLLAKFRKRTNHLFPPTKVQRMSLNCVTCCLVMSKTGAWCCVKTKYKQTKPKYWGETNKEAKKKTEHALGKWNRSTFSLFLCLCVQFWQFSYKLHWSERLNKTSCSPKNRRMKETMINKNKTCQKNGKWSANEKPKTLSTKKCK